MKPEVLAILEANINSHPRSFHIYYFIRNFAFQ
jgi:hypothetical protein